MRQLLLAFTLLFVSSCGCFTVAQQNTTQCILLKQVISCSEDSGSSIAAKVVALILKTVSTGTIDWSSLETMLEGFGVGDAACIIAAVDQDFVSPTSKVNPMLKTQWHNFFDYWRKKHLPNVTIKIHGKSL